MAWNLTRNLYLGKACAAPPRQGRGKPALMHFCFAYPALTHFVALRVRPEGLTYLCVAPTALGGKDCAVLSDGSLLTPSARVQSNSAGLAEVASSPGRSANCGMIYRPPDA